MPSFTFSKAVRGSYWSFLGANSGLRMNSLTALI